MAVMLPFMGGRSSKVGVAGFILDSRVKESLQCLHWKDKEGYHHEADFLRKHKENLRS